MLLAPNVADMPGLAVLHCCWRGDLLLRVFSAERFCCLGFRFDIYVFILKAAYPVSSALPLVTLGFLFGAVSAIRSLQ